LNYPLILASGSARRRKIVLSFDRPFEVMVPDVEETIRADDPRRTASLNARAKHDWCRARRPDASVLAADTVIDLDGRCIGKPADLDEAKAQLAAFAGRVHTVLTAAAFSIPGGPVLERITASSVRFRRLDSRDIARYVSIVPPLDKAGSYDIDQHPELIIESFLGSRSNVMGLPSAVVKEWMALR
jgi:septum formation protein